MEWIMSRLLRGNVGKNQIVPYTQYGIKFSHWLVSELSSDSKPRPSWAMQVVAIWAFSHKWAGHFLDAPLGIFVCLKVIGLQCAHCVPAHPHYHYSCTHSEKKGTGWAQLSSQEHRFGACTRFLQSGNTSESCSNGLAKVITIVHDHYCMMTIICSWCRKLFVKRFHLLPLIQSRLWK